MSIRLPQRLGAQGYLNCDSEKPLSKIQAFTLLQPSLGSLQVKL